MGKVYNRRINKGEGLALAASQILDEEIEELEEKRRYPDFSMLYREQQIEIGRGIDEALRDAGLEACANCPQKKIVDATAGGCRQITRSCRLHDLNDARCEYAWLKVKTYENTGEEHIRIQRINGELLTEFSVVVI